MPQVIAAPEMLARAAADVADISSAIGQANSAAAGRIAGVLAPAADEVSKAADALFGAYAREYQTVIAQAAAFHDEFARALAAAGAAYANAEAANAAAVSGALNAPVRALLGSALLGNGVSGGAGALTSAVTSASTGTITSLIMGGTGDPIPDAIYLAGIQNAFIQPRFPGANANPVALFTPEQFWPVTPQLGTLTFGQSVAQGVALLDAGIKANLQTASDQVAVFGFSQSATIATNHMHALNALAPGQRPDPSQLSFTLVGNPNTPNGGLLTRFPGFYIPFLDVAFGAATPPNSPYPTSIYTIQYDGIAHAPQYPLNLVADLNAFMGYFYVHGDYPMLTPTQVANAHQLPTSPGYTGNTEYYMVLTQNLPLLEPIRQIPFVGPPIAEVLQPNARVFVDLGYGNMGYGHQYADVSTPASLIQIVNPITLTIDLARGTVQGTRAALVVAGFLPHSALPDSYPYLPSLEPNLIIDLGQPSVTGLSVLSGALGSTLRSLFPPPVVPPLVI